MPDVIPHFLVPLARNSGDLRVPALLKLLQLVNTERVEQKLSYDRYRKISNRQLDDLKIPIVDRFTEVSQRVFVAIFAFSFAGNMQIETCLTDQIERDVGESNVFLENRRVPAPFRQAMSKNETIIAKPEEILEEIGVAQKPFIPRGTL
jgi:hypothetical protein